MTKKLYAAVSADSFEIPMAVGTSICELERKLELNPRTLNYYNNHPEKVYKKLNIRVICAPCTA